MSAGTDHMAYLEGMEQISSDSMDSVRSAMDAYDSTRYTREDVLRALSRELLMPEDFAALLSPAASCYLEDMAAKAQQETRKHFGNSIYLFTPLYLSNYCENHCVYCGFNAKNKIHRARLGKDEMEREMQAIAATGLKEILLLTGESPKMSSIEYIGQACIIARKYFSIVGLEIYPVNSSDYAYLRECGADFITVFQETYDASAYERLHPAGHKRVYPYRFYAQERALMGGMRGVGFAALLGLHEFRKDAYATGMHAWLLQRKYPAAEITFSCPRLRPILNNSNLRPKDVGEAELLQVIAAYRLFMPYANITISSRESIRFRDNVIGIAATKISAGVDVGIGGHTGSQKGDEQFEIDDGRSVGEIFAMILEKELQPVVSDYIYV